MHLEHGSVFRLADPVPLDNLDGFIQSLGCPKILQDSIAVFGSGISYQFQNGGIASESLFSSRLGRYVCSSRILAGAFFQNAGGTDRALAITLSVVR
jgi:hypothetical protein